jgi:hypothetical protein
MSMKFMHRRRYPIAPVADAARWASTVLGGLVLLAVSDAAAQIGGQTGTVPGFPQFYESFSQRSCNGGNTCKVNLGLVSNRLFMATDIMCTGTGSGEPSGTRGRFTLFEEKSGKETLKNIFDVADIRPPAANKTEYVLHASLLSFFAPNSQPTIIFSVSDRPFPGSSVFACKLAGNLVRSQ